eukprot:2404312-Rhodomonas_salina.2
MVAAVGRKPTELVACMRVLTVYSGLATKLRSMPAKKEERKLSVGPSPKNGEKSALDAVMAQK